MQARATKHLRLLALIGPLTIVSILSLYLHREARRNALTADAPRTIRPEDPRALLAEANRLSWLFNWYRAGPLYARAETIFRESGDRRNELYAEIGRIRSQAETGSFVDISNYLAAQLRTPQVQNDPELKLWCLVSKGMTDIEIDPSSAKRAWGEARGLAKRLGKKQWEARAEGELGLISFLEGDSWKAGRMVGAALLSAMSSGDIGGQIRYLELIGNGLNEIRRQEEALQFFDRAIRLASETTDAGFPFMAYEGKGDALLALNRPGEARTILEKALAEAKREDKRGHEADCLILLGKLFRRENDQAKAVESLEAAGALANSLKFYRMVADTMFELAPIYQQQGDFRTAEARLSMGLEASQRVGDRYYIPRNLTSLADLKAQQGQLRAADSLYAQAEDVIDGLLVDMPGSYSKSSLLAAMSATYLGHFRLAVENHDVRQAFEILERARGRTAADILRSHRAITSHEPSGAVGIENSISLLQLRLMRSQSADERNRLLEDLEEQDERLAYLTESLKRLAPTSFTKPADLSTVQGSLRDDELLVEYVLDDSQSFCVLLTREQASVEVLPTSRREIEDLTDRYLAQIEAKQPSSETSRQIYTLLVAPVLHRFDAARLVIVPDGKLHLLPFDSLQDGNGHYLFASRTVSYSPSATVLEVLRTERRPVLPARAFLGVGDVIYQKDDGLLAKLGGESTIPGKILRGLHDLTGLPLPNLPESGEEVIAAERQIGGKNSVVLLGKDATEGAFQSLPLGDFKIIHLAVHAIPSSQYPQRAALVLGRDGKFGDGLLQEREIAWLPLNADLVTLSACDTGVGRLEGEEGVNNLAQSFIFAGARAVVATLWEAQDNATNSLMQYFYRHLGDGQDKASALREAKVDFLEKYGRSALPYYWAGFVMIGEGAGTIASLSTKP